MARATSGLRWAGILLAAFAGGAFSHWCFTDVQPAGAQVVMGGGVFRTKGAITAGALQLSDKQGNVYAELALKNGSPVLVMYGKDSRECVVLSVDNRAGETSLKMTNTDPKSQAAIEAAVAPDGTPRLKLSNAKGARAWEAP
jgi:hypothetical protein